MACWRDCTAPRTCRATPTRRRPTARCRQMAQPRPQPMRRPRSSMADVLLSGDCWKLMCCGLVSRQLSALIYMVIAAASCACNSSSMLVEHRANACQTSFTSRQCAALNNSDFSCGIPCTVVDRCAMPLCCGCDRVTSRIVPFAKAAIRIYDADFHHANSNSKKTHANAA